MLFPIGDDNTTRRIMPVVTYTLIAVNILVFFLELSLGDSFIYGYSTVPREIMTGDDLVGIQTVPVGDKLTRIPQAPGPPIIYLTLFSSMFMHGGWGHLLGNMLYLWIFGDNVEDEMGHGRFIVFYLICGLLASFAHIASGPNSVVPSLGASGAIAGVLGGYLVLHPRNQVRVLISYFVTSLPAVLVIGFWFVLQLINGYGSIAATEQTSGTAWFAHIGGFVAGMALVFLFRRRPQRPAWT